MAEPFVAPHDPNDFEPFHKRIYTRSKVHKRVKRRPEVRVFVGRDGLGQPQLAELRSLLTDIAQCGGEKYSSQTHANVLTVDRYLRETDHIECRLTNEELVQFSDHLSRLSLPGRAFAADFPYAAGGSSESKDGDQLKFHAFYEACLQVLSALQNAKPVQDDDSTLGLVQTLASFTQPSDPWTNESSYNQAKRLLDNVIKGLQNEAQKKAFLARLLSEKVKPLFAKSKNPDVTDAGRKAISPLPVPIEHSIDEAILKPWKYQNPYVVTVFEWATKQLDRASVEANWPLIIPPLLALLDDRSTVYKVRGCSILDRFLQSVPNGLLERTGLGQVFQGTLMPYLLYLPSLTPEDESRQLLDAVYPALLILTRARYNGAREQAPRQKVLDSIFRYGVLKGYTTAGDNARIATILMQKMNDLIDEMALGSCTHLKHVLPLLSSILSHPFATAYPPLLIASLEAVEAIIRNAWPRVVSNRGEILRGLAICWLKVLDEDGSSMELDGVQRHIKQCVKLLTAVLERAPSVDVESEYKSCVESDTRLEGLLL